MSDGLAAEIMKVAKSELERASAEFGDAFVNEHEAFAVIYEEYEEAEAEQKSFKKTFAEWWDMVKHGEGDALMLGVMEAKALNAAAEWAQVAAMCAKAARRM